nr:hypothetical protein CFP56_32205 [Quercus suber]
MQVSPVQATEGPYARISLHIEVWASQHAHSSLFVDPTWLPDSSSPVGLDAFSLHQLRCPSSTIVRESGCPEDCVSTFEEPANVLVRPVAKP